MGFLLFFLPKPSEDFSVVSLYLSTLITVIVLILFLGLIH
ncbi:hypothetical protein DSUL_60008 [Desulfovibrionales bacterium]